VRGQQITSPKRTMMRQTIEFPDYLPSRGVILDWENGYEITARMEIDGTIVITANRAGLISLGRHFLTLAQPGVPSGAHLHLDAPEMLDDDSASMILELR
jgi:hypothetical protein